MKRLILALFAITFSFALTGCDTVHIEPGVIGLMYDDPVWTDEGDLLLTVYVTNGLEEEFYVQDLVVEILTADEVHYITYFWDDIEVNIAPDEYAEYEITFFAEEFEISKADLEADGYNIETVDDISVYFEVNYEETLE